MKLYFGKTGGYRYVIEVTRPTVKLIDGEWVRTDNAPATAKLRVADSDGDCIYSIDRTFGGGVEGRWSDAGIKRSLLGEYREDQTS